jgi:hypothetical protein
LVSWPVDLLEMSCVFKVKSALELTYSEGDYGYCSACDRFLGFKKYRTYITADIDTAL